MAKGRRITLRLQLEVTYDLDEFRGTMEQARAYCRDRLDALVSRAANEGALSGVSEAITVESWNHSITPPDLPSQIPARVQLDDGLAGTRFDALPWFRQASAAELRQLWEDGFSGSPMARTVASFCAHDEPDIKTLFAVLDHRRQSGDPRLEYHCFIQPEAARRWIEAHLGNGRSEAIDPTKEIAL